MTKPTKDPNTSLAYLRTKFASERTLMAWVRTAVSLIGFGFSIPKFFALLQSAQLVHVREINTSLVVGLFLTGLGTFGLLGGMWQHIHLIKGFGREHGGEYFSPAMFVSVGICLLGFLILVVLLAQ